MVEVQNIGDKAQRKVIFTYSAAPGRSVALAGMFNDWDPSATPLDFCPENSTYRCEMLLCPGIYEYKLIVNGEWMLDDGNPNFASNDFGTLNSVVEVK